MDFLCLNKKVVQRLKRKCKNDKEDRIDVPFEYFNFDHFKAYGKLAIEELKDHKAIDAVLAKRFN